MGWRRLPTHLASLLATSAALSTAPAMADDDRIDLKLFGKAEIGAPRGCSVSLWQANRDPEKDRYAYVFHEALGADHGRQPARVEIGGRVVPFRRVAVGGRERGYRLFDVQLYRSTAEDYLLAIEIKSADEGGEAVSIEEAVLTFSRPGKLAFRVAAKGGAGCVTPAASPPPTAPSVPRQASGPAAASAETLSRYEPAAASVPRALLAEASRRFQCDPAVAARVGVTGWRLSRQRAIWEIPCETFAYSATAVMASVDPEKPAERFAFLPFSAPDGSEAQFALANPQWDARARTVASFAPGRGPGDCGVYQVHAVVDGRFRLVEYREKKHCDGKDTSPRQFPLVFKAR